MFWRIVRDWSRGESARISATEPMRPARRAERERDGAATMRPACGSSSQDGAQRARAEPQVDARLEDDAGLVVRVGHAQARDLNASAAPLRGKGAAGAIPRARLGRG